MKMTSSNIRMCVISRKRKDKQELIQITNVLGNWKISNLDYQGRSFYITKEKNTIEKFLKKKKLKIKNFEMTNELKEELIKYAKNL